MSSENLSSAKCRKVTGSQTSLGMDNQMEMSSRPASAHTRNAWSAENDVTNDIEFSPPAGATAVDVAPTGMEAEPVSHQQKIVTDVRAGEEEQNVPIRNDWFETEMLNKDDFCLKDKHEDFLISLEWIISFGIAEKNDKFTTAHLVITTEPDSQPSELMKALQKQLGDEIERYVDLIVDKGCNMLDQRNRMKDRDEDTTSVQTPLQPGDAIYIDKKSSQSYGSLCAFAKHKDIQNRSLYALTCYHVLHNGKEHRHDELKNFNQLQSDSSNGNSKTSDTLYGYRSRGNVNPAVGKIQCFGTFYKGIFNNEHDLGIVLVNSDIQCNPTIPGIEGNVVAENTVLETMIKEGHFPDVFKTGPATGLTKGKVIARSFCHMLKVNGKNVPVVKKAYKVIVNTDDEKAFMEEGDSGSLVLWQDNNGNLHPFAYCCKSISPTDDPVHKHEYVCFSLEKSLKVCDPQLVPYFYGNV